MAGVMGANVEQLKTLGTGMQNTSVELTSALVAVQNLVNHMAWVGSDADAFRNDWSGTQYPALKGIATMLSATAGVINQQAIVQQQVSEARR
jgi:hypothetical protein